MTSKRILGGLRMYSLMGINSAARPGRVSLSLTMVLIACVSIGFSRYEKKNTHISDFSCSPSSLQVGEETMLRIYVKDEDGNYVDEGKARFWVQVNAGAGFQEQQYNVLSPTIVVVCASAIGGSR
jgi:hypothetical protein